MLDKIKTKILAVCDDNRHRGVGICLEIRLEPKTYSALVDIDSGRFEIKRRHLVVRMPLDLESLARHPRTIAGLAVDNTRRDFRNVGVQNIGGIVERQIENGSRRKDKKRPAKLKKEESQ